MTQEQKIKKLGKVMNQYFTNVKVGLDFWEDGFVGVVVSHNKSKVEIIPNDDTNEINIMFIEEGKMYPCDEVVNEDEYDFFGEFLFKSLVPQS